MSTPLADVTITLRRVLGLTPALLAGTADAYLVLRVDRRWAGRTATIAPNATEVSLLGTTEFTFEVRRDAPADIAVQVVLYDDRGDTHARLHDVTLPIAAPWASGTQVFGAAGGVQVECDVATRRFPSQGAPKVPRGSAGVKSGAVLVLPHTLRVELTEVRGLYQPVAPSAASQHRRAMAVPGYTSDDHLGRVFINADLTGAFKKDAQLIELTATVTATGGPIPPGAKLLWTVFEPDNPANTWMRPDASMTPNVHQQWGPLLDADDYVGLHSMRAVGPTGADAQGTFDHDPVWEQVGPYALDARNPSVAATDIVGGKSAVTLHCRNEGGERFVVTAGIENPSPATVIPARTGVMTMWKRVDLRYLRMDGAVDLPVDRMPASLEPACVQLDIAPVRTTKRSPQFVAKSPKTYHAEVGPYVESEFDDADKRGWFCVIAAKEPYKLPGDPGAPKPPPLYEGDATITHDAAANEDIVEIAVTNAMSSATRTALRSNVQSVEFSWEEPAGTPRKVLFDVFSAKRLTGPPDRIQYRVYENDVTPEFEPNDGSIGAAYKTQILYSLQGRVEGGAWHPGGYRIPSPVKVKVFSAEASAYVAGTSPTVEGRGADGKVILGANGKPEDFFAGRTIVFTQHRKLYDAGATPPGPKPDAEDKLLMIIIHELTHAFGNPHKCGNFDFLVPRAKTCCMNYYNTWVTTPGHELVAGSDNLMGFELCGRHIWSIRRTHLEDNPGLGWK
jgi:hypothetical protein